MHHSNRRIVILSIVVCYLVADDNTLATCMDTANCQDGISMRRKLVKNVENTLQ